MSTYKSQYTGAQIDEAVGKALSASDSGSSSGGGSKLYKHTVRTSNETLVLINKKSKEYTNLGDFKLDVRGTFAGYSKSGAFSFTSIATLIYNFDNDDGRDVSEWVFLNTSMTFEAVTLGTFVSDTVEEY